jgi:VWFA-related protein
MRLFTALFSVALMLQDPSIITVDVRLQQVVATVRDSSGKIVKGLKQDDFIIEDSGTRQTIAHFSDDPDAPISLGILIDTSGSMGSMPGGSISGVAAAAGITRVLLKHLKPDDEIVLMTFSSSFTVRQGFTKDHRRIEDALAGLEAKGNMSVLAAIDPALEQVRKSRYAKRALILMSDAYFSGDLHKVAADIRRAEVPIFAFAMRGVDFGPEVRVCTSACHQFERLPPILPARAGPMVTNLTQGFLDTIANETGGRATIFEMHPRDTMIRINAIIDDIAAELRGQYLLGYYPTSNAENRTIRVRAVNSGYSVHMRREVQPLSR